MKAHGIEITEQDLRSVYNILVEAKIRIFVPKNKKNKVGIVVAINTESDKEKVRLENDLIRGLEEYLNHSKLADIFYVIKFPPAVSKKIKNNELAKLYLGRSRSHLMLFGDLTERNLNGNNNFIFKLHGIIRHTKLPDILQQKLVTDFSTVLPNRIVFPETQEFLGFEFTKDLIGYVAKYIIGYAAKTSRDFNLSYDLIKELHHELKILNTQPSNPLIVEIEKRNNIQLIDVLNIKIALLYGDYSIKRDENYLWNTEDLLKELWALDPGNYSGHLMRAILLFKKNKLVSAIDELRSIQDSDPTWRYSLGFLYAFNENIDDALEQYRKASYGIANPGVLNDTEIFISEEIGKNPKMIQLVFFRGLINYKGKLDYLSAKTDFEHFLGNNNTNKYEKLVLLATKYLSEIETHVGRVSK